MPHSFFSTNRNCIIFCPFVPPFPLPWLSLKDDDILSLSALLYTFSSMWGYYVSDLAIVNNFDGFW